MKNERIIFSNKDNIIKTFSLFLKYRKSVIGINICIVILILLGQIAATYFPGWIVDLVTFYTSEAVIWNKVIPVILFLGSIDLLIDLLNHKKKLGNQYVSQKVSLDIKEVQLGVSYDILEKRFFQDIVYEAIRCTETWGGKMTLTRLIDSFFGLVKAVLGYLIFSLLLSAVNPIIAVLLTVGPLVPYYFIKKAQEFQLENRDKWTRVDRIQYYILYIAERLEYGKDIRMYSLKNWFMDVYHEMMDERGGLDRRLFRKKIWADISDLLILLLRDGLCYFILIKQILIGKISPGTFVIMFAAVNSFANCVNEIIRCYADLRADAQEINSLHNTLEIFEQRADEDLLVCEDMQELVLENVSFKYDKEGEAAIRDITLTINSGEKIALIGANGAGKTTLIKLICGLYFPTTGNIRCGGVEYTRVNAQDWSKFFSCLFQDINVLPYSIAEIVSSSMNEEIDVERVEQCLRLVGLSEKVSSFPKGIYSKCNKTLNENGIELSGGERQKLLLARTLYRETPFIILDEPTSALDPLAEEELYQMYKRLLKDKTIIFVSHRLSSTRFCDRIFYMENGTVVEEGTFSELMKKGGKYAEMFSAQARHYVGNGYKEIDESE